MKLYELEFTFFSGSMWKDVTITILAESKYQLMKAFLYKTYDIHNGTGINTSIQQRDLWKKVRNEIDQVQLPFITMSQSIT